MRNYKTSLFAFVVGALVLLGACDEALNVPVEIPASDSQTFTIPATELNADPDNTASGAKEVDLSKLVDESGDQIESIKLDKFTYEVSGYNNSSGNLVLVDLTVQTRLNGTTNDILTIFGLVVENTGEVIAFEDGNPASALSAAQVASIESVMDNSEPFEFVVTVDATDDVDSDFDLTLSYDVTITANQDLGG